MEDLKPRTHWVVFVKSVKGIPTERDEDKIERFESVRSECPILKI
jgi:hypothetical protein